MSTKPTFESHMEATLKRATGICTQRGTEYKDSWANPSTKMMDAVASKLGFIIPQQYKRALMLAVLVDVKYNRLDGGYKDDSVIDSINYNAVLAEEMEQLQGQTENPDLFVSYLGKSYQQLGHNEVIKVDCIRVESDGIYPATHESFIAVGTRNTTGRWYKPLIFGGEHVDATSNSKPEPKSASLDSPALASGICPRCLRPLDHPLSCGHVLHNRGNP